MASQCSAMNVSDEVRCTRGATASNGLFYVFHAKQFQGHHLLLATFSHRFDRYQRMEAFRSLQGIQETKCTPRCIDRIPSSILGTDEEDLRRMAMAVTFAVQTRPWRLEIDL